MASGDQVYNRSEKLTQAGSYIVGKFEWTSKQDASENKSQLEITVYVRKNNIDPNTTLTEATTGKWKYLLKVGDYYGTLGAVEDLSVLDWTKVVTYNVEIPHDEDGTKIIPVSGYVYAPTGTNFEGCETWIPDNTTINLGTISRAATVDSLKCDPTEVTGKITVYYTPKATTHYIRRRVYVNANNKLTLIPNKNMEGKATSTSQQDQDIQFNAEDLSIIYSAVTTTATATIRVTLQTYSDSGYKTQLGTDQSKEITLTLPKEIVPTVDLVVTPVNTIEWIANRNLYVVGLSGAKAIIQTAESGQGIEAKPTTSIVYNGTTYAAAELNVTALKTPGEIEFIGKATDTRGRTATDPVLINVLSYYSPVITYMEVERGTYENDVWTASGDGEDVEIKLKTALRLVAEGNKYSATFSINGDSILPMYGSSENLESGTEYTFYFVNISGEKSHTLKFTATDSVGKSGVATIVIPTTQITVEYNKSGKGIAFGKTSEEDAFECAWNAKFGGDLDIKGNITKDGKPFLTLVDITHAKLLNSMTVEQASVIHFGGMPTLLQLKLTFAEQVPKYTVLFNASGLISGLPSNRFVKDTTTTYELELRSTLIQTTSVIPAGTYTFYCFCVPVYL